MSRNTRNEEAPEAKFLNDLLTNVFGSQRRPQYKIPVDIVNDEKSIQIYAEAPGVQKDKILVDFYNNKLTISFEKTRRYDPEVPEITIGTFERTINLPICVTKKESVVVSYADGILHIKIDKLLEEENKFSVKL